MALKGRFARRAPPPIHDPGLRTALSPVHLHVVRPQASLVPVTDEETVMAADANPAWNEVGEYFAWLGKHLCERYREADPSGKADAPQDAA